MQILGEECKCMRQAPKQAIEWALDYHIISVAHELAAAEVLLEQAKKEFEEITGKEPEPYKIEGRISRLKKEEDFYIKLRKEIIELPRCPEPAFEAR